MNITDSAGNSKSSNRKVIRSCLRVSTTVLASTRTSFRQDGDAQDLRGKLKQCVPKAADVDQPDVATGYTRQGMLARAGRVYASCFFAAVNTL